MPDGWAWSRLEPIASLITDYVANGSFASLKANVRTYKEKNYALFVRTVDFANNFKGDLSYIDKESYDFLEKSKLYGGELMLSNIGASIGKVFKVPHLDTPMSLAPNAIILRFFNDITCDYFEYVFKSFVGQNYLQFLSGGAAMPKFNKTDLRAMIVPVPPIKEQERIVESVKNTFIGIDDLDISYSGLANTIQSVKSKILDLAIRGKLVPQDPNDEPASVLLERIRAEKEELIKQGKIKRDKKESVIFKGDDNSYYRNRKGKLVIIDNELPMKIPNTWTWAMLPEIVFFQEGPGILKKDFREKGIPLIRISGLQTDSVSLDGCNYLEPKMVDKKWSHFKLDKGDVILCTSASIGKASIVGDEAVGAVPYTGQIRFKMSDAMDRDYFLYLAISNVYLNQVNAMKTGNCIQHYGPTHLQEVYVPLPPLTEQKRIVTSIKKYINLLDKIESSLV